MVTDDQIREAMLDLEDARILGDQLTVDLAEDALNDLLQRRFMVTVVTDNKRSDK